MRPFQFQRIWIAVGCFLIAVVLILSLWPGNSSLTHHRPHFSVGHTLAYLVLMIWFANIYSQQRHWVRLGAIFFSMGIAVEFLQPLSPGRTFMLTDIVANGIGLLLGFFLAHSFLKTCLWEMDKWLYRATQTLKVL